MKSVPEKTTLNAPTKGQATKIAQSIRAVLKPEDIEKVLADLGIDKDATQRVIGSMSELQGDITNVLATSLKRLSVNDQFADEERQSSYGYLSGYQPGLKDLSRQIDLIRSQPEYSRINPDRAWKLAQKYQERSLVDGAEKWFASVDPTFLDQNYSASVKVAIEILSRSVGGKFTNYLGDKLGPEYLRQVARTVGLESQLRSRQGSELWIEMGQFGKLHAGQSVRRARGLFPSRTNEYGGGIFKALTWLSTHDTRLKNFKDLCLDCAGDEYSPGANGVFGDAPFVKFSDGLVGLSSYWFESGGGGYGSISGFMPSSK